MHNYLTNTFPETIIISGKVFLINCDFKHVVKIITLEEDSAFNQQEKMMNELCIFYGKTIPANVEIAYIEMWAFINLYSDTKGENSESNQKVFDFEVDSALIYEAFMKQYQIDLGTSNMHWYKFICLLQNMNDNVKLNEVIQCRGIKITNEMSDSQKKYYRAMKKRYALEDYDCFITGNEV